MYMSIDRIFLHQQNLIRVHVYPYLQTNIFMIFTKFRLLRYTVTSMDYPVRTKLTARVN